MVFHTCDLQGLIYFVNFSVQVIVKNGYTRRNSSRIRTVRCSLPGGDCLPGRCLLGGCLPRVGCLPRGCLLGGVVCPGVSAGGVSAQKGVGVSAWGGCLPSGVCQIPPPPCERNDCLTGVKTLPCRNYVADGNNPLLNFSVQLTK